MSVGFMCGFVYTYVHNYLLYCICSVDQEIGTNQSIVSDCYQS